MHELSCQRYRDANSHQLMVRANRYSKNNLKMNYLSGKTSYVCIIVYELNTKNDRRLLHTLVEIQCNFVSNRRTIYQMTYIYIIQFLLSYVKSPAN